MMILGHVSPMSLEPKRPAHFHSCQPRPEHRDAATARRAAGRPVGKGQLVERLCEWGEEVSHNGIDVYIHRLRKRIEKGCARP